jgi:hypothetical protein
MGASLAGAVILFAWQYFILGLGKVGDLTVSHFLNRKYPDLEESSDLLVLDEAKLTELELLQRQKTTMLLSELAPSIQFPQRLKLSLALLLLAVAIFFVFRFIAASPPSLTTGSSSQAEPELQASTSTPAGIEAHAIEINPPAYTQLRKSVTVNLNFEAVVGSTAMWRLEFTQEIESWGLKLGTGERIEGNKEKGKYAVQLKLDKPAIYKIVWEHNGDTLETEYYRISVKEDHPPAIRILDLPQFTRLKWGERSDIQLKAELKDDFGISASKIIATVSKGSGESVKFREVQFSFTGPKIIKGKLVNALRNINFDQLGMEPDDELYFYVEAFDNRLPAVQRSRTDTYFIALQDTTTESMALDEGLGVDLMPEYFRSQRQIIIDTEKLLAEGKKLTQHQFKNTSNELGYDQKVLRLRYGQFLGEEFETNVGPGESTEDMDASDEENVVEEFGHEHDTDNEHNLVADEKAEENGNAMAHSHDNTDEATFFTQSIKAKLREALTLMWDSELQLRLFEPAKSLPYQYQILKLLKEISQDSRIYVHRMGFDPPPLKEEKRLTGDLAEIHNRQLAGEREQVKQYPAIKEALKLLNHTVTDDSFLVDEGLKQSLQKAGDELAGLAVNEPGKYLHRLSDLNAVIGGNLSKDETLLRLKAIQRTFLKLVPFENASPTGKVSTHHHLDVQLLKALKNNE